MRVERRELRFEYLQDAVVDAENLLEHGYCKTGNWDLTQCCHHLSITMLYPIDGFPKFSLPLRVTVTTLRYTIAPAMLRRVIKNEKWPDGVPTDKDSVPLGTGQDAEGVEQLRNAVDRLLNHTGRLISSPLFGYINHETLIKLHRIHTAHNLGFLVPQVAEQTRQSGTEKRIDRASTPNNCRGQFA